MLTNSPPVAVALAAHPRAEVVLIGGRLLKDAQVTVGATAVDALRQVRADACVLGERSGSARASLLVRVCSSDGVGPVRGRGC